METSQSQTRSPDNETQEALIYGSSYPTVTAYRFICDHGIDITKERIEDLNSQLNRRVAALLLIYHPELIHSNKQLKHEEVPRLKGIGIEVVAQNIALLREIGLYLLTIEWFKEIEEENSMAGRLIGACEHSAHARRRHSDDLWMPSAKRATDAKPLAHRKRK